MNMELNKIYQGDCRDLIKNLDDKSMDVCLTDFPYGVNYEYKSWNDTQENLKQLIDDLMPELFRVSKLVVITCGVSNQWLYPQPTWVLNWYCKAGSNRNKWGFSTWQPILVYGSDPYLTNCLGCRSDTIEKIEIAEKNGHPCPKPINLWRQVLNRVSVKQTDIIFDPFMGSGTTAIASIMAEKNWIGFEMESEYIEIANERIQKEKNQLKLFQINDDKKPKIIQNNLFE